MRRSKSRRFQKQRRLSEVQEIELLQSWIESQKPDSGSNPLSLPPLPRDAPIGQVGAGSFSQYAGATKFDQLPISKNTKDGLRKAKFEAMTDIQRASLPHALCGRDILGAAKTGSGKTLAFLIPVLEKLYRERWSSEDGVGSIIISPTIDLAAQIFDVLRIVGKHHGFSAGLLIGGRSDVDVEKQKVNELNILVCTPGRLLQHMNETPNFDCSQLQVLVLDEADRLLDEGFKKQLNAIVSQLPRQRQTLLFSATQTKSVKDLARLSLKDPEYLSVHQESVTATPNLLQQTAMIVPLEQKIDMLWSFIRAHLRSRILVFLSTCKQVKFFFETFKKLRPGIPLKCLHGRMKPEKRMGIYHQFCDQQSLLFSTDVAARGLDFNKAVDWVVQVDCPDDVASYIHRVGRTARFHSTGKSVLFLMPSEMKMLEKLREAKIPVQVIKVNTNRIQPVSEQLKELLAKYPNINQLAQRAFITYLRSIHIQKDREIFDVTKLSIEDYSLSLGLAVPPKVRFLKNNSKSKAAEVHTPPEPESSDEKGVLDISSEKLDVGDSDEDEKNLLLTDDTQDDREKKEDELGDTVPATRISKKKKLKINIHRPLGTRVVFDDDGNSLPPLARVAQPLKSDGSVVIDREQKDEYYRRMKEEMEKVDKEDKRLEQQRRREKRIKQKMKWKKGRSEHDEHGEEEDGESDSSISDISPESRKRKKSKIYFDSDGDDGELAESKPDSISLAQQEELALKLLNSIHS